MIDTICNNDVIDRNLKDTLEKIASEPNFQKPSCPFIEVHGYALKQLADIILTNWRDITKV